MIGYVDPASTTGNFKLKVIRASESVAATESWDLVADVNLSGWDTLDRVYYLNNSSNTRIGNFVSGGDWASVTTDSPKSLYETFDYANNTTMGSSTTGGAGWISSQAGYHTESGLTGANTVVKAVDYTWSVPTGYNVDYANKGVRYSGYIYRGLAPAKTIETTSDPIYFSYLFRSDGSVGGNRFGFASSADGANVNDLQVRQIGSFQFTLYAGNTSLATTTGIYGTGDLLVIGYVDPGATTGNFKLKVIRANESVATTESWDLVADVNLSGYDPLDRIYYLNNSSNTRFGNFVSGESWGAVIGNGSPAIPATPSQLAASVNGSSQIDLSWNDNSGNEDSFIVQRSETGIGGWMDLVTLPADSTSYSDSSLSAGDTAYYRVLARSAAGDSTPTSNASATLPTGFANWLSDQSYTGNDALPDADPDNDGVPNLVHYALGIPAGANGYDRVPQIGSTQIATQNYATLSFTRDLAASEVIYVVQHSIDLSDWNPATPLWASNVGDDSQLIERTDNGDGTETITVRHHQPMESTPKIFLRLQLSLP